MATFKSLGSLKAISAGVVFFLIFAIPTIIVGSGYYQAFNAQMTNAVFSQRVTIASLSAAAVQQKIEQLAGITENIAADPSIITDFTKGTWGKAQSDLENLLNDPSNYNYYISRTRFVNTEGVLEIAYPGATSSTINTTDIAFAEWQAPILQQGMPWYISNVHLGKTSGSDYVELVVPVKNAQSQIIGVVESQIYTNNFSDFGKDVDIGSDGFAYFVDRNGNIVTHPKYSSNGPLISYVSVPAVKALLAGQSGVGILYNPIERVERVSAYTQVPGIGWGVVAQEPSQEAFANRDSVLGQILHIIIFICFIELLGACLLIWLLVHGKSKRRN